MRRLYLTYKTGNIGDDIQTLAAIALQEGSIDIDFNKLTFIDRDDPHPPAEPCELFVNCWYATSSKLHLLPPHIEQTIRSIHTASLSEPVKKWLKKHAPVKCRDVATVKMITGHGIKAVFARCPTLSLRHRHFKHIPEKSIPVLDVDLQENGQKDAPLIPGLVRIRHHIEKPNRADPVARLELARELLLTYLRSRMIITSRLHCFLPCVGLGIPVFYTKPYTDPTRLTGYENLIKQERMRAVNLIGTQLPASIASQVGYAT